jgi:hypothetical protein
MRAAIGMPKLRMYDLRHTCITRLLSNPNVPERVVIETVGHVNNNMLQRYSHQRLEDKAKALRLPPPTCREPRRLLLSPHRKTRRQAAFLPLLSTPSFCALGTFRKNCSTNVQRGRDPKQQLNH